jgi:hypothetical protein
MRTKSHLDKNVKDKWGLPVLNMDVTMKENEIKMRQDMMNDAKEMLEAAGILDVDTYDSGYEPGMGIHEMGTARMGRDHKSSVLNKIQSGMGCTECICNRWCLYDFLIVCQSVINVHGINGSCSRLCCK